MRFAVLGLMPRRSATSSFEHPAAMSSTTWRCRSVIVTGESFKTLCMWATLEPSLHVDN